LTGVFFVSESDDGIEAEKMIKAANLIEKDK